MYIYSETLKVKSKSFLRNNTALNYFKFIYIYPFIKSIKLQSINKKGFHKKNIVNAFLLFYAESSGPEKYLLQSLVQEKNILCDRGTRKIQT